MRGATTRSLSHSWLLEILLERLPVRCEECKLPFINHKQFTKLCTHTHTHSKGLYLLLLLLVENKTAPPPRIISLIHHRAAAADKELTVCNWRK